MSSLWWFLLGVAAGVIVMIPVTRLLLRRAESRARRAERRARDAERLAELGSMTGGLAHEIKNPLSTIGLNAQLLAESISESDLPQDQKDRLVRRLDTLGRETERLRGILTDFLQFAGRMKLDPQPRDLVRLVDELSDFFHPQAQQAGVVLRTQLPAQPVIALIDEALLKQAVLNLMLNATQAMTGSVPTHSARPAAAGELILRVEHDDHEARIVVIDTGPGIERDRLDEIFLPYVSGRRGGTGLGLPTAKRIAQEHGGDLTVHSEPGKGSAFSIHLPTNPQAHAKGG
jgi:signal transduction histidine kinase